MYKTGNNLEIFKAEIFLSLHLANTVYIYKIYKNNQQIHFNFMMYF